MNTNQIKNIPISTPYVEGIIRFSREEDDVGQDQQRPEFELLSRVHQGTPEAGKVPKMVTHPLADSLMHRDAKEEGHRLLTQIPIRFLGRTSGSILRARYQAVDTTRGRIVCTGDGSTAKRTGLSPTAGDCAQACRSPANCEFAKLPGVECKLNCRMHVQVDGSADPLAVFEFQTSGINSYQTLAAKLAMLEAIFGNLSGLPFMLTSWSKSSPLSDFQPFYVANIELREGMTFATTKGDTKGPLNGVETERLEALEQVLLQMAQAQDETPDATEMVAQLSPGSEVSGNVVSEEGGLTVANAAIAAVIDKARTAQTATRSEPTPDVKAAPDATITDAAKAVSPGSEEIEFL